MGGRRAALAEHVASAALWAAGAAWLAVGTTALRAVYRVRPSHEVDGLTRLYTRTQVALTLCRWRARVDPAVRPDRPYVFVQNHVNVLDHCTMYAATPHFKQGMELRSHFDLPFYGPFMEARGTLPVDPGDPSALLTLRRRMREELSAGRSLLAFPEGTRTRDGRVGPFQHGLFHLARSLRAEIVPVAVTGMWEVLPTGGDGRMRPFQDVTVHVMAPVPTEGRGRDDVPQLVEHVRGPIVDRVEAYYARRAGEGASP